MDPESSGGCGGTIHRCNRINKNTQRLCNAVFSRASSLKRHDLKYHQNTLSTVFITYTPGAKAQRSVYTSRRRSQQHTAHMGNLSRSTSAPADASSSSTSQPWVLGSMRIPNAAADASSPSSADRSRLLRAATTQRDVEPTIFSTEQTAWHSNPRTTTSSESTPLPGAVAPLMPQYITRESRKTPGQPKGIDWLTQDAKTKFDATYESLLASWGVTTQYWGTCVLVPEDWRFCNPLDLMALFSVDNVPSVASPRAWYSHADHGTSLVRAKVWYSKPSRTGLDLDVFIGGAPYQSMDASHLCHHEHCIVHVVYEAADINQHRQECVQRARFLRSEKRTIPSQCAVHDPPCMMQHAAITALEAYYHQFTVLSHAYRLPPPPPTVRPRRYPYPTFEPQLPCQFDSVSIDEDHIISNPSCDSTSQRPNLTCQLCSASGLKTFASIIGYWSHIVNKHQAVSNDLRCHEIRSSASQWREYWETHSRGGKRNNPTLAKLKQTQQADFCWMDVMEWRSTETEEARKEKSKIQVEKGRARREKRELDKMEAQKHPRYNGIRVEYCNPCKRKRKHEGQCDYETPLRPDSTATMQNPPSQGSNRQTVSDSSPDPQRKNTRSAHRSRKRKTKQSSATPDGTDRDDGDSIGATAEPIHRDQRKNTRPARHGRKRKRKQSSATHDTMDRDDEDIIRATTEPLHRNQRKARQKPAVVDRGSQGTTENVTQKARSRNMSNDDDSVSEYVPSRGKESDRSDDFISESGEVSDGDSSYPGKNSRPVTVPQKRKRANRKEKDNNEQAATRKQPQKGPGH
ncbi:MAG: hypothetical protein Q9202_000233 [Teloschistes flavicans]